MRLIKHSLVIIGSVISLYGCGIGEDDSDSGNQQISDPEISDLKGDITLNYTYALTFKDQARLETITNSDGVNLISGEGTSESTSLGGHSITMHCLVWDNFFNQKFPDQPEVRELISEDYYCTWSYSSGSDNHFSFNMNRNGEISGVYEYSASDSDENYISELQESPDAHISGSLSRGSIKNPRSQSSLDSEKDIEYHISLAKEISERNYGISSREMKKSNDLQEMIAQKIREMIKNKTSNKITAAER